MGKNQNKRSHRTKIIFHPLGSLAGFPSRIIVLSYSLRAMPEGNMILVGE
jgi:hypothetical protein